MRRSSFAILVAALLASFLASGAARAHGGLPVSENIFFHGDTMIVPAQFWGVFIGKDDGKPWRWICEEALDPGIFGDRRWLVTGDGTWYGTNPKGLAASTDDGCDFTPATGDIAQRTVSGLVADPADPKRAWATTNSGMPLPWNALFTTVDRGATWTPVLQADEYLRGVALSSDGQRVYVTGNSRATYTPPPDGGTTDGGATDAGSDGGAPYAGAVLHVSSDGGKSWRALPIDYQWKGFTPEDVVPLAVDPRDANTVYLLLVTDPTSVLLRAKVGDAGLTYVDLLEKDGTNQRPGVAALGFNTDKNELFIAAADGLYRAVGDAMPAKTSMLDRTQCLVRHGASLYACSFDYPPDSAAVARSDDDGASFTSIYQYVNTAGLVQTCPAHSQVADVCPTYWLQYGAQLGIDVNGVDGGATPHDGGTGGGGGCAVGRAPDRGTLAALALVWAGAIALILGVRRKRAIARGRARG